MDKIPLYTAFLEGVLTPNRLKHSLGVMQVMGELAGIYHLNREAALTAGLLHDAAKDLPPAQYEPLIQEAGIQFRYPCEREYSLYLHGPIGAYYVSKALEISDPFVLDAIAMHTWVGTGPNFHAPLTWCLRFADILEPYRRWDDQARRIRAGAPRLRALVYAGQLEAAARHQADILIQFFEEAGMPVHPNYEQVRTGSFSR